MRVYRIEREKYLESTLQGIGASMSSGFRWNSRNTHMVYTAESRALAILEIAVHLDLSLSLPTDRFIVEIEIPDEDVEIYGLAMEELPARWDAKPPTKFTQVIGDNFVHSRTGAVLKVPSSIASQESNYLINPHHQEAANIRVINCEPLALDQRLFAT